MKPYYEDERSGIAIYHGDCRDILPTLPMCDLLLSDPCYGTTELAWDIPVDWASFWPIVSRACTPRALQVLFSAQPFTTDLIGSNRKHWRYEIIWHKSQPTGFLDANRRPLRAHENIQVFCEKFGSSTYHPQFVPAEPRKRNHAKTGDHTAHYAKFHKLNNTDIVANRHPIDVVFFPNGHGGQHSPHETAKPIELMLWLIASYSNPGDLVIDPFMGSGTTLEAAKRLGRRAIGIDIRAGCCETAVQRLSQEVMVFL